MSKEFIRIGGAREHNLKNLTLSIPRDQLVVVTGSGGVVVIPDTTNGYPVASIGNNAFSDKPENRSWPRENTMNAKQDR